MKGKLDPTAVNLKGEPIAANTEVHPLKPEMEETKSAIKVSPGLISLQNSNDVMRIVNNVVIKLIKGTIEKEGVNVSENIIMIESIKKI